MACFLAFLLFWLDYRIFFPYSAHAGSADVDIYLNQHRRFKTGSYRKMAAGR